MRLAVALVALSVAACTAAQAQSNWDKTYSISAKPSLQLEVDDAGVRVNACGGCRAVHVRVDWHGADASHWKVTEMQGGNGIHFALRHREERSFFGGGGWHGRSPEVIVETPSETDLNVRSGDGSVAVAGLRGSLDLRAGDGSIHTEQTAGPLRVFTGDGSIQVQRAEGTLSATAGSGSMNMEGRFSQVDAHTGDGSVQLALLPGSNLQASSRITTGDGSVNLRLPRDLRATLQASSGDGSIVCNLPLQSNSTERHNVHGLLNGGGPTLRVQSGDGSIMLSSF